MEPRERAKLLALLRQLADSYPRRPTPDDPYWAALALEIKRCRGMLEAAVAPSVRVFGRVRAGLLECPHCASMIEFTRRRRSDAQPLADGVGAVWDWRTGVLRCRCGKRYILGLAIWDVTTDRARRSGVPLDQIPSDQQAAELRDRIKSRYLRVAKGSRPQTSHVLIPDECSCEVDGDGRVGGNPACPVHHGKG
ncbi:hypothetical protein LCGC14_1477820 [marine sediment metagenome]|uniref:Uncharacterized protein n=1 Tax=marine sediment metagenome TaxID=412755 RepID=A0A0F9JAI1_9ZZZZ